MFPPVDYLGMNVRRMFYHAFLWLFMARWVPIFVVPFRRVAQLLLPASMLRGFMFMRLSSSLFTSLLVDSIAFFVITI
jgi:hypothetical protein